MSVKSVNQLYQEVMQELDLLQQFIAAPDRERLVNVAVEKEQQKGCSFTVDEVQQTLAAQSGDLSDEQLEAVA